MPGLPLQVRPRLPPLKSDTSKMLSSTTSHRDSPSALKREVTYRPNSEKVIGSENIASKMSHNLFGTDPNDKALFINATNITY